MAMRARRGRTNGLVAAILVTFALAACQLPPRSAAEAPPSPPATPQPQQQPAPGAAAPTPQDAPDQTETAALPPEPKIDDNPARLMGLDTAGLAQLLGPPELMRREPPAEIWQYRGATCVFDVFLYEETGLQRVTYLEARDGAAQRIAARNCLNELLRARIAKPLG